MREPSSKISHKETTQHPRGTFATTTMTTTVMGDRVERRVSAGLKLAKLGTRRVALSKGTMQMAAESRERRSQAHMGAALSSARATFRDTHGNEYARPLARDLFARAQEQRVGGGKMYYIRRQLRSQRGKAARVDNRDILRRGQVVRLAGIMSRQEYSATVADVHYERGGKRGFVVFSQVVDVGQILRPLDFVSLN